jgi:hypothetical protein
MRFITKTWLVLVAVALVHGAAWAASFSASLDRETMTLGEQATLSLKFEGVQPQKPPALPQIAGLQFQYVGPSSSFSFINGQTSSSITFNYIVTAQHDGDFTIPGLRTKHWRSTADFHGAEAGGDQGQRARGRRRRCWPGARISQALSSQKQGLCR